MSDIMKYGDRFKLVRPLFVYKSTRVLRGKSKPASHYALAFEQGQCDFILQPGTHVTFNHFTASRTYGSNSFFTVEFGGFWLMIWIDTIHHFYDNLDESDVFAKCD